MSRASDLEAGYALFAALPEATQDELKVTLDDIAKAVLAEQEAAVPVRTGKLKAALTIEEALQQLRVRIGLPQLKGKSDLFYGVVVEKGRTAGEKRVQRRKRVDGKLRLMRRRKRLDDVVATYTARWSALPARPFVHIESRIDSVVNGYLDRFWGKALARINA